MYLMLQQQMEMVTEAVAGGNDKAVAAGGTDVAAAVLQVLLSLPLCLLRLPLPLQRPVQ